MIGVMGRYVLDYILTKENGKKTYISYLFFVGFFGME
jgi:hypothetical protein